MKTKDELFGEILDKMYDTYKRKNHDYSVNGKSAFEQGFENFGLASVAQRLGDKVHRITAYAKRGSVLVNDETVLDTLLDNAVYSVLALVELKYSEQMVKEG